jgi:glutathione S-transferase
MKLYYAETINPRKACAVAKYLNSPVEFVRVDLGKAEHKRPGYLAINPNGKVPALEVGDFTLWEADAIMTYLAQFAGSDLLPSGDRQVELMRWLSWNSQHFTRHAGSLYFQHIIRPRIGMGDPDPAVVAESTGFFRQFAAVLDQHLAGNKYLLGEQLTIADFSVAVTLPYSDRANIPLGDFPNVVRWHERMNELPAWREPFPKPDALAA